MQHQPTPNDKDEFTPLEKDYWRYVDHNYGERLEISYAADLPADKHGSGFPTDPSNEYSRHPWNLNHIYKEQNSLLQFFKKKISGVTVPWLYAGTLDRAQFT